jgi:hypothetical protein
MALIRRNIILFLLSATAYTQTLQGISGTSINKMVDDKLRYKEQVLKLIQVQDNVMKNSSVMDMATKEAFLNFARISREQLDRQLTLTQMKSLANGILTFWRESIGVEVENFWTELSAQNVNFERRDELEFALSKHRFRRVDMGMAARKDWVLMKELDSVKKRFSQQELVLIEQVIKKDENDRLEILRKCLKNNEIPQSKYLKFGECMAYFTHCGLFNGYFSQEQVGQLNTIWLNFKSK